VVKNGHSKGGKQTYLCRACGKRFVPEAKPLAHPDSLRAQVLAALEERMSLRGAQRVFGVHRNTITSWIKKGPPS
jgi:transposase-like protein